MPTEIEKRISAFQAVIADLEKKRKSRIFCLVQTGREHISNGLYGVILRDRDKLQNIDTLEVLIHSGGGHPEVAYQVAKFLRRHCKRLNMIVPMTAKSAATLMCLIADTIYMGEIAELGPLDIQIEDPLERGARPFSPLDEFKSMEYLREHATEVLDYFMLLLMERSGMSIKEALHEAIPIVTGMMQPLYSRIDPTKIGGYRRSLAIGEEYAKRLLKYRSARNADDLTQTLTWEYPAHEFAIDYDEAKSLGLPVLPLNLPQEKALINSIVQIVEAGVGQYGFVEPPKPSTKTRRTKKSRKAGPVSAAPATPARLRPKTAAA
jgi:hypothetical protein